MEYWSGSVNWNLDKNWICETCGYRGLTWGLPHAERPIVGTPISLLKDEYKIPAKLLYEKLQKPIDEFSDDEWDSGLAIMAQKQGS